MSRRCARAVAAGVGLPRGTHFMDSGRRLAAPVGAGWLLRDAGEGDRAMRTAARPVSGRPRMVCRGGPVSCAVPPGPPCAGGWGGAVPRRFSRAARLQERQNERPPLQRGSGGLFAAWESCLSRRPVLLGYPFATWGLECAEEAIDRPSEERSRKAGQGGKAIRRYWISLSTFCWVWLAWASMAVDAWLRICDLARLVVSAEKSTS